MLIGPQKSGKTTLAALLEGREMAIRRVPNMVYREKTLDTPGAYLETVSYTHLTLPTNSRV